MKYKFKDLNQNYKKKTLQFILYMDFSAISPPILLWLTAKVIGSNMIHNSFFVIMIIIWILLAIASAIFVNKWYIRHQILKQNGESKDSVGNEKEREQNE